MHKVWKVCTPRDSHVHICSVGTPAGSTCWHDLQQPSPCLELSFELCNQIWNMHALCLPCLGVST